MTAPGGQDQDVARTGVAGQENENSHERKGLRSYWRALPRVWKVLTVILSTIGTVLAILAPLGLIGPSSSPPPPTGFQGYLLGQTGIKVRETPKLSGRIVAVLPPGTTVFIACTKKGDAVTGPGHGGGTITTPVWDYVRTANAAGFVPDALVNTGGVKPAARSC